VVVFINPKDVPILLPALFLFSKRLKVEKTTQANQYTQCTNRYRFGHPSPRCSQKYRPCPYCALHHTRSAHRCQTSNPTFPKGGDSKAVTDCCPTSPPHGPNSGDDDNAFYKECSAGPILPPRTQFPPRSEEDLSDSSTDGEEAMDMADDGRPAATTPGVPPTSMVNLSTIRPFRHPDATHAPLSMVPGSPHRLRPATADSL